MKKIVAILVAILVPFVAIGAIGSRQDSLTVSTYLRPAVNALDFGTSALRWDIFSSSINTGLSTGACYIDGSNMLAVDTTVSPTELGYLNGVTSALQTQIDAKLTGPLTGDVTTSGSAATIANDAVSNAKMANMGAATFKGRQAGGGTGDPEDLTATQAKTALAMSCSDLTDEAASCATDATNASNISSGTLASARLPGPAGSAISSTDIDWSSLYKTGGLYTKTLGANTTFTYSNRTAGQTIVVRLTNTASNYTVTWPTVKWCNNSAPTMSTGAVSDVYTFIYDGTDVFGCYTQGHQ